MDHSKYQKKIPTNHKDFRSVRRLRGALTQNWCLYSCPPMTDIFVTFFSHFMSLSHGKLCYKLFVFSAGSDAVRQGEVVLLSVSDQRTAVDLAPDPLLHHLPPVELQARVHCVHTHGGKVWKIISTSQDLKDSKIRTSSCLPAFSFKNITSFT